MSPVETASAEILSEIIRIVNATTDLEERLRQIVDLTAHRMGQDVCSIFLLEDGRLVLRASQGLNPESIGRASLSLGEGLVGWACVHRVPVAVDNAQADPRFKYLGATGEERFQSLLTVPILLQEECIGGLVVQTLSPSSYNSEKIELLTTIASAVSGVIRTAQLYKNSREQLAALTTISEISRALISTLDLDRLLNLIVEKSVNLLNARGAILRLLNPETQTLEIRASYGLPPDIARSRALAIGEGIAGRVAVERRPVRIDDASRDPLAAAVGLFKSIVCVPLVSKNQLLGTLALYDKGGDLPGPFSERDEYLLVTVGEHVAIAVENALAHERSEALAEESQRRLMELSILYDIGQAMSTTVDLNRLLQIILTGVTIGGGLGFNRAMLFLYDDRTRTLEGVLGVGPRDAEEAWSVWQRISHVRTVDEWAKTTERTAEAEESALTKLARSIRIKVTPDAGVLARTVLEAVPFNIPDARNDPRTNPELAARLGTNAFATVPLIAKNRVMGAILVDNLFNQRPITDEDVRFLMLFAHQAGRAIENAQAVAGLDAARKSLLELQDRLIQTEKMAALGEMAASIAHEIRNPLAVVGGFARRLMARLPEAMTAERHYGEIIVKEVKRLEKILEEVLVFSRDARPDLVICDIASLVNEVLSFIEDDCRENGISLTADLPPEPVYTLADPAQVKQALLNLFTNAVQAIRRGGEITVHLRRTPAPEERISIEIADTGGGIPGDIMANIFNPFFTTKATGTGLGLAITRRIVVDHHKGEIEVVNRPGEGAMFRIHLPAATVCPLPEAKEDQS